VLSTCGARRADPGWWNMPSLWRIVCMLSAVFAAGLGGLELYARHVRRYALSWLSLRSTNFIEPDRMKIYNRRFYEQRRLEIFESANNPAERGCPGDNTAPFMLDNQPGLLDTTSESSGRPLALVGNSQVARDSGLPNSGLAPTTAAGVNKPI
jgi:hypothetical protein